MQFIAPKLYPKQRAAIFEPKRYSVIEASTKAGKTVGCMVWLLDQAVTHGKPGRAYWWVAPVYPVAKIAYRRMRRMLTRGAISTGRNPDAVFTANDTEQSITLQNGAVLSFRGADRPDTLYGEDVFACVIDEASRCKEEAWHAVRSTLTHTRGHVRIIGNVKGKRNWAWKLGRMAKAGEPDMAYHRITALDAVAGGVLAQAEVDNAKRVLPDPVFRELYLAEASDDGSNPFGLDAIRRCVSEELESHGDVAVYGVDLAKSSDYTAVVGLDDEGREVFCERWQAPWRETKRRLSEMLGETPALIDSTGVGDPIVEDLQAAGFAVEGFKFTSTSKQQIMTRLGSAIQQTEVQLVSPWLVEELESFEYEHTASGMKYSAPPGLHDDGVCALALAVHHRTAGVGNRFSFRVI